MRQVERNFLLTTLDLSALTAVGDSIVVRARPRPRSADRARHCAHRAEPPLLLSLRVAMRVCQVGLNDKLTTVQLPALTSGETICWGVPVRFRHVVSGRLLRATPSPTAEMVLSSTDDDRDAAAPTARRC